MKENNKYLVNDQQKVHQVYEVTPSVNMFR